MQVFELKQQQQILVGSGLRDPYNPVPLPIPGGKID